MSELLIISLGTCLAVAGAGLFLITIWCYYYIFGFGGKIVGRWTSHGWSYSRIELYLDGILLGEGVSFNHNSYKYMETCSRDSLEKEYKREERALRKYVTDRLGMTFGEYVSKLKCKRVFMLVSSLIMMSSGYYILANL